MRVDAVIELSKRKKLSPLQGKVLHHLETHADEVFTYRDVALASQLSMKPAALGFTLWTLHKQDLVAKAKVGGKVYFGSHRAVAELQRRADGSLDEDWFERANRIRDEIFQEHGNIDVLELLDDVREGQ